MKILKYIVHILLLLFLGLSSALFSILLYVRHIWPNVDYEQILVTMQDLSPHFITDNANYADYFFAFLFFILVFPLCYYFFKAKGHFFTAILLLLLTLHLSGFISYYISSKKISTLYEDEYIYPEKISMSFPEKKRNLILIYLESFEQNFANERNYGANLIPFLSRLREEGEYSQNYSSLPGSDYSIASLVASHCGIPLRYNAERDIYALKFFLPSAVCFSDVLHENGYQSIIIKAADITFTYANIFAASHGYDAVLGTKEILEQYPESQHAALMGTFGGINDKALFSFAQKKLAEFSSDKPFFLTLFSLDTHMPTYYQSPSCPALFKDVRDAYMCTDKTVYEFISWLKESPYWDNTTVVIMGDHLLPVKIKTEGSTKHGIYTVFLNLPEGLKIEKNKPFSTFDMTPSILESLGIKLFPAAFGLGRSLFAKEDTLIAAKGFQKFKNQIRQNSKIYTQFNTPQQVRSNQFLPYHYGDKLSGDAFLSYTDAYEEILGLYYLDRLNMKLEKTTAEKLVVNMKFSTIFYKNSQIIFIANGTEVFKFSPKQDSHIAKQVSFKIPSSLIENGQLQLIFRNTCGIGASTQMGIAPMEMVIEEK